MSEEIELPVYKSHKKVHALKIRSVKGNTIDPWDDRYAAFEVDDTYIAKHAPYDGGYYVVYEDGYKSFSPAKAFEEGYEICD